jgi:50S ribosomal protein L16 3-hydroxylase
MTRDTKPEAVTGALRSLLELEQPVHFWQCTSHLAAHGDPKRFATLFDVGELEDLRRLVARHRGNLTATLRAADGTIRDIHRLSSDDALHLYDCGATLHIDHLHGSSRSLGDLCRSLADDLGLDPHLLRTAAFAARGPGPGSPVHADNKDIFVVHLRGAKTWRIGPNHDVDRPLENVWPWIRNGPTRLRGVHTDATVEMRPGSVLFLPRNHWHATEVTDDHCFAITIGFERPPWVRVVTAGLYNLLLEDPEWREPIESAWGDPEQRAKVLRRAQALKDSLMKRLVELPPSELLEAAFATRDPQYVRVEGSRVAVRALEGARWVAEITLQDGIVELEMERAESARMLEWISSRVAPFSAADVGREADTQDAGAVLRFLEELTDARLLDRMPTIGRYRDAFY